MPNTFGENREGSVGRPAAPEQNNSSQVAIERHIFNYTFKFREFCVGAQKAGETDVGKMLEAVLDVSADVSKETAKALSNKIKASSTDADLNTVRVEAEAKDKEDTREAEAKLLTGFRLLSNFFRNLDGQTSVSPDSHTPGLYKLDKISVSFLEGRYQDSFKNDIHPVGDNKKHVNYEDIFIVSRQDAEKLNDILKKLPDDRFRPIKEFSEGDGFVAYLNGVQVKFLYRPK